MAIVFIRAVILLITLLVVMRFMGKRQIGEMEPFEFIITLVIAELICVPMSDVSIPLVYGVVSVLAAFILHQAFTMLERSGRFMRKVISGSPSIVINPDGVNENELKKNNISLDDLMESLRGCGVFSLRSALYAIFESNGKLSVLKNENVSCNDIDVLIVSDGKIIENNLETASLSKEKITALLDKKAVDLKDVAVMTVNGNGETYFQKKQEKYEIFNLKGIMEND